MEAAFKGHGCSMDQTIGYNYNHYSCSLCRPMSQASSPHVWNRKNENSLRCDILRPIFYHLSTMATGSNPTTCVRRVEVILASTPT